jgi:hypothetical protein
MIILQLDSDQLQTIMQNAIRKVIAEQTKQESNSNPLELKDLLTISEASNLLNLAKASIYNLVCKKLYFSRQELTEWIKQGKKKTINEMQEEADNFLAKKKRG